ncbi:MAG TPA: Nramp family divalent metal transporter [Pirellulaceae bacterium]|nr:Nramp family divalent metal transporter [Pirellulaceae bacterium]
MSDQPIHEVEEPPLDVRGILLRLGPGLIIAASIVGSGELIATTKTGAEAGFWLLWLIIVGCVIKVFVQVELGRDAIVRGKTTLDALGEVPGPRVNGRGNWLVWYYFLMFAASSAQLGAIIGGVGQAMAISAPVTEDGRQFNRQLDVVARQAVVEAELRTAQKQPAGSEKRSEQVLALQTELGDLAARRAAFENERKTDKPFWTDDKIWATIIAVVTSALLVVGRYGLIQNLATAMVAIFTLMTVVNVLMLQNTQAWAIRWQDLADGLRFRLPPADAPGGNTALLTALKTFGIIGVGASELISYPYWCLEKGYARFTGPRDKSDSWAARARGWMTVMRWDAWCSMVIYTIATVAFYLLGAAILSRSGLVPEDRDLIRTLNVMYEPVFGSWAKILFLLGSFAVLYSTFFVANAGNARVFSDALRVMGLAGPSPAAHRIRVKWLSGILPLVCLVLYLIIPTTPAQLVLLSGMMQALMLPMLAGAALYFRYTKSDSRVTPGRLWDAFLWISSIGMLISACVLGYGEVKKFLPKQPAASPPAATQPVEKTP